MELVKKVREATGAGVNDVKKALDEALGNEQKAVEILRKQGLKLAAKKAERSIKEGVIVLKKGDKRIAVVELNCETDFVARNQDFLNSAAEFAQKLLESGQEAFAFWAREKIQRELIVKIGENIQLGKYEIIEGEVLGSYLHANNKIATVVELSDGSEESAKEVAMQVAAMSPKYLKPEDVPQEVIDKEKEIYRAQLLAEGKPEAMLEKIMEGKLQKFYGEVCLLKQSYIKDDKMSVEKFLGNAKIIRFVRYSL